MPGGEMIFMKNETRDSTDFAGTWVKFFQILTSYFILVVQLSIVKLYEGISS